MAFLKMDQDDRLKHSAMVNANYETMLGFGYTAPLTLNKPSDIWNYVYPNEIFVHSANKDFYTALEHGLSLIIYHFGTFTFVNVEVTNDREA